MGFIRYSMGILAIFFASISCASDNYPTIRTHTTGPQSYKILVTVPVADGDALYADYISFSIDHPHITLSQWTPSIEPISKYDTQFKQTKKLFIQPVTLSLQATLSDPSIDTATLHMATVSRLQKNKQFQLPLSFAGTTDTNSAKTVTQEQSAPVAHTPATQEHSAEHRSYQQRLLALFTETESWWLRLLLALMLGFILSLTPCIYPMIPITVGILQSQGSTSVGRNFFIAFTYVVGIATTFAALGTAAAFSGKMFGGFMQNPFVIIAIVAFLAYLAGSMIGLYDMYVPRFMQSRQQHEVKKGSFLSIFLFGAASGTVASPCLSPGLVLLLSMVTAIGSMALGFVLLFFFGIGLGIPLLLIGTFSGSLSVLPRAGSWMVDVKQFFGFFMLATCLYFLASIMPVYIIAWMSVLLCSAIGIFYFVAANKTTGTSRIVKNLIGISLIALSVYLAFEAYKQTDIYLHGGNQAEIWIHDYTHAIALAKAEGKKLFIDISAPYCSICKAIDKKIFSHERVQQKLAEFVTVKIEDIEADETTQALQKRFSVLGAPTILVYDPEQDQELKRWGGELYDLSPDQFIEIL